MATLVSLVIVAFNSCKNKKTRTCYFVENITDTVGIYRGEGLFNRHAEKECEAEEERRDTLEEYSFNIYDCDCDVGRQ